MQAVKERMPTWLMLATVAILAVAVVLVSGTLAGAKKKKKAAGVKVQTVESTVTLPNTGSCNATGSSCTGAVQAIAACPANRKLTGGGVKVGSPNDDFVEGSYPSGNTWVAFGFRGNNKTGNSTLTAYAICAK